MTNTGDPGPDPSPDRDRPDQTTQTSDASRHGRTQRLLLTTNDVDLLADILQPALGLIATLRIAGHNSPLNVQLDDVTTGDGQQPQLVYTRVDSHHPPAPPKPSTWPRSPNSTCGERHARLGSADCRRLITPDQKPVRRPTSSPGLSTTPSPTSATFIDARLVTDDEEHE